MEEDAEGMLRPKPKEQPMSKLCEAWATAARLEETCERSGGGRECARAIEHDQRACGQSNNTKNIQQPKNTSVTVRTPEKVHTKHSEFTPYII